MKRLLLLGVALSIGFLTYAQQVKVKSNEKSERMITGQMSPDPIVKGPVLTQSTFVRPAITGTKSTKSANLTILTLGTSTNGFSYGTNPSGNRCNLWADDKLNTVINIHRMGPGTTPPSFSGYLAVDKSIDMGATFTKNFQVYSATHSGGTYYLDAARYPQGGIYNPVGNTNPANAYITYFAPTLDGSNATNSWGGYALGVANLMNNADSSKHNIPSRPADGIYQDVPDGFTICQNSGDMWGTDRNSNWTSGSFVYAGGLILTHGIFDAVAKKYNYTQTTLELAGAPPAAQRIAFAPDGQTGWVVALGDINNLDNDSTYRPILWKTTNGGLTWSNPIEVILWGPNGINAVKNYLNDGQIANLFGTPIPNRDAIAYSTAFDCNLVVDVHGNPHIAVVIAPSAGGYALPGPDFPYSHASFDITTFDGGLTWKGQWLKNNKNMRHTYAGAAPAPTEDNRIQASTTMDGTKVFISWIETSYPDPTVTGNDLPDIFTVGIDVMNHHYTDTVNVTNLSEAWLAAFGANASHYVFTANNKFTIPYTYEVLTGGSLDNPVTYKYISDFSFTQADFTRVGINENNKPANTFTISPAFPNPTTGISVVKVNLDKAATLSLAVYNLTGEKMFEQNSGYMAAGAHNLTIDCTGLNAGVYFYTVKAGDNSVTKKLVVK